MASQMTDEEEGLEAQGTVEPDGQPGWFGVRCVFRWSEPVTYEERVTLWEAHSLDDAIAMAEEDALAYASRLNSEYLQMAQAYWIGPSDPNPAPKSFRCYATASSTPTRISTPSLTRGRSVNSRRSNPRSSADASQGRLAEH